MNALTVIIKRHRTPSKWSKIMLEKRMALLLNPVG